MGGGGRGRSYTYLYSYQQNDSCIEKGSDESHFNVSLTVMGKATRQCPQTTTFGRERRAEANLNRCLSGLPA